MASIKFRFTTECEMTLHGATYEDIYLQFKDFIHGDQQVANEAELSVFPPESIQIFFDLDSSGMRHEIPQFKGDYQRDIANHCMESELMQGAHKKLQSGSNQDTSGMLPFWYGS